MKLETEGAMELAAVAEGLALLAARIEEPAFHLEAALRPPTGFVQ